jgi:AraC family transcriptional regulator
MSASAAHIRKVEPLASGWRSTPWPHGCFDTAGRAFTPEVQGLIRTPDHVLLVTLSGSADALEVEAECGHRYSGPDRAGVVSFVPAGVTRRLRMHGVASSWGSMSLKTALFEQEEGERRLSLRPFSNRTDPFVFATIRMLAEQPGLDTLSCEAVGLALARYLTARYGEPLPRPAAKLAPLSRAKMARLADYIDAHLDQGLSIADLAIVAGLSTGYFHRAFRLTTGMTPLAYIQRRRVERAVTLLRTTKDDIATIALDSGFSSPSHFARIFRRITGRNPSEHRD